MIRLAINNSYSRIDGVSLKQYQELKELLSYSIDPSAAYFSGTPHRRRTLLGKRGDFPTGLLYLVKSYLKKRGLRVAVTDHRKVPEGVCSYSMMSLGVTPYPEQVDAATACLERHRGIVVAPTALGKSFITALIIRNVAVRTLVVVPKVELKSQLTKTLSAAFPCKTVGPLGSDIAVENVDALDPRAPIKGYDCVIVDEFHHAAAATYRKLNRYAWKSIYYRFGLTATPFRSQDHERLLLESFLSKVIYRVEYDTAVQKGYITPVEAYYVDVTGKDPDGYTWAQVYKELVVSNFRRNNTIAAMMLAIKQEGRSVLCLVKEIAHGEILSKLTGLPFANGQSDDTGDLIARFSQGRLGGLIGTTGVMAEGVDTRAAEYIMIAGLGKSKNQFMQQVGRGLRRFPGKETCKVILFRDQGHKWTEAHFKAQVKYLREEYGVKPGRLA